MKNPLVTIGLITFNAEKLLPLVLKSIHSQDWHPLEIIAVDDKSSDSSIKILHEYSKNKTMKIFRNNKNSGVAVCRNKIIKEAKGEFLVFFDDDDISLPNRITQQYERIVNYEKNFATGSPVICHTARRMNYPNGKCFIQPTVGSNISSIAPTGSQLIRRILMGGYLKNGNGSCATCSQMARISTYNLVGGFDPNLRRGEDTDLVIKLASLGAHFVGIKDPLVIQNMTFSSDKNLKQELEIFDYLIDKHEGLIKKYCNYEFVIKFYDLRKDWFNNKSFQKIKKLFSLFFRFPLMTIQRIVFSFPNYLKNLYNRNFMKE